MLAMTHQAKQFNIIISITNPYSISLDLIQSFYPSIQPNFHMLISIAIEVTCDDLSSHKLVFVIFLKGLLTALLV